ncbi:MAG: hypothetical protein ACREJB_14145, partial [Planctomycetaceae bacterium]
MIATFALRLICGMSLFWLIMPRREVTSGFFRIQMLVTLGLSVLAAVAMDWGESEPGRAVPDRADTARLGLLLCVLLAVCSFLGSAAWILERRTAGTVFAAMVFALATAALLSSAVSLETAATGLGVLRLASELSASAMLGGAMVGMLLGHWHLTSPTMSIAPLSRVNVAFGVAGLVRLALSAVALALVWDRLGGTTHLVWLTMRWTAGIMGPL